MSHNVEIYKIRRGGIETKSLMPWTVCVLKLKTNVSKSWTETPTVGVLHLFQRLALLEHERTVVFFVLFLLPFVQIPSGSNVDERLVSSEDSFSWDRVDKGQGSAKVGTKIV